MQNYEQILKELEIQIPEDKKEALKNKMDENYRTKADYEKATKKRDEYKQSLEDVQGKLDGFKDVDVDDLKGQIQTLQTALNNEKTARAAEAAKAEREKTVRAFLESVDDKGDRLYPFLNDITENYYRNAVLEELEKDSAKGRSIGDIFTAMITGEDGKQKEGIFVNKAEAGRARFTMPGKKGTGGNAGKKLSEMTLDERIRLKESDPEYYESLRKGD